MAALVSVIISFLDGEPFFEEAIESVRGQTYPHWEMLLIDDGSRDGSTARAQRYADADPDRIRYIEHSGHVNKGVSASRNLGLRHARGAFLAFLDADDVWTPEKLDEQIQIMEAHPTAAMTYGRFHRWYGWTGTPDDAARDHLSGLGVPPNILIAPPTLLHLHLGEQGIPGIGGVLVRREVVDAVGGFEEDFSMHEDQLFLAKICAAYPVFVADNVWYKYRQHDASRCAEVAREGGWERAWLDYLHWLKTYLHDEGVDDPSLHRLIRERVRLHRLRYAKRRLLPAPIKTSIKALRDRLTRSPATRQDDLYAHERRR